MTGYWELKPTEQLEPYDCLRIESEEVEEFITFSIDERDQLQGWEKEHIYDQIKEGYVSGQWDSGD